MIYSSYEIFFATLANENRLAIISYLAQHGPKNVTQIVRGVKLEQTVVSHNLQRLLSCQFVHLQQKGKQRVYSLNQDTVKPLLALIDKHVNKYCRQQCDSCNDGVHGK